MNLSQLGNMFAETSSGENAGKIKEESFVVDPDFDIGKLSVSPVPYESLCLEADESSSKMVSSDVLDADVLFSAFDSFSFADLPQQRNEIAKNSIETDAVGSICDADPPDQIAEEGKNIRKFDSSDCDGITEPSSHDNCHTGVVDEIDKAHKQHHPLIVYTSSRRKSVRNTITKLNQSNESRKPSRNCRRIAKKHSALDLNSLQISRRKRSLFSKPARSSVWGYMGSILPAFEEHSGLDLNLDKKKLKGARGGQGKRNAIRDQTGRKSVRKSCTPTGHISLKIKIGNQSCGMVNFNAPGNSIHGLPDSLENKFGEEVPGGMLLPHERNLEKIASSDTSVLGSHIDVNGIVENSSFSTSGDVHQISSQEEGDNLGPSTENRCSDPGTSPDSEVINSVPDAPLFEKGLQNMQDSLIMPIETRNEECFTSTVPDVSFGNVSSLSFPRMKSKKGKKKDKHDQLGDCSLESQQTGVETRRNAKAPAELGSGQEVVGVSYCHDASMSATVKPKGVSKGPLCCSSMVDPGTPFTTAKGCAGAEMNPSSGLVAAIESDSQAGDKLIPFNNRRKFPKSSKATGRHAGQCGVLDLPRKKDKSFRKKGDKNNLVGKHQIAEKGDGCGALGGMESHLTADALSHTTIDFLGNGTLSDLGETGDLNKGSSGPAINFQLPYGGQRDQYVPPRNAWVLCDDCQKWRRIPATLADQIEETNCGWTCKDNMDKDFADCSIPQEKSNSEINEELEISDASCEEDACDALLKSSPNQSKVAQQSSWSLIKSNLFLHRSRKNQTIDEVMVCHCKPPADGRMGCGAKCLNRMLNIECVQGTCPCGEFCSNQQFQRRKYAKLKWFRCGKKGFGLQALDDISEGQFLIEYVGEVLDMHAYQKRQRDYALQGHRHFYFMTLNGSEVIDASAKGNLGRFINHSCDPNCRTEKWMVNGEVCVGLFALRDIKKGEEVTFDYNYVRVFGAAAKKCVCGSPNCRGYIGGDPTNSEVIVQDDSDDEYAEPVMICEDREMNGDWSDIMSNSLHDGENESPNEPPQSIHGTMKLVNAASQFESTTSEALFQKAGVNSASADGCLMTSTAIGVEEMMVQDNNPTSNASIGALDANRDTGGCLNTSASATCKVESEGVLPGMDCPVQLIDVSLQSEGSTNKAMPLASVHGSDITTTVAPSKSQPDTVESKRKLKYGTLGGKEEIPKSDSLAKARHSSSSIKKGKIKSIVNSKGYHDVDKSNAAPAKPKKLPDLSLNSQVEAVEDKLNELLDTEGGISKRKDASRGYLKLLFLTAASGANGHGEAIQSNRDLSMILDALLKTKSRTVLVDIINKNGLQMLHNIMKRYRKEFIKTPILRKLLKVLEYLAVREILTLEHITGGPPCPGVESFKDSILTLTEHVDKQVHQIARNFRDRWIPRSHRKSCFAETDDWKTEFHQRLNHGRSLVSYDHWNDRAGKPAEATECFNAQKVASGTAEASTLDHALASGSSSGTNGIRTRKRKSRWDNPTEEHLHPKIMTNLLGDGKPNNDEDIPPGFSPPFIDSMVPSNVSSAAPNRLERDTSINHPFDVVLGDSQQRFIARMPVSYGVPSSVMQQFGVRQAETAEVWTVAPGLPFHPFPPLPPHARNTGDPPTSAAKCASLSEPAEKSEQVTGNSVAHHSGQKHMTTQSMDPPEINISIANDRPEFQREGGSSSLGRKYFRQQKWNPSKLVPPWVRMRNSWGYGGNTRNGGPGVCSGNGANQFRNSYNSEEFNWRGEF